METQSTCGDLLEIYRLWRHNLSLGTFLRYMGCGDTSYLWGLRQIRRHNLSLGTFLRYMGCGDTSYLWGLRQIRRHNLPVGTFLRYMGCGDTSYLWGLRQIRRHNLSLGTFVRYMGNLTHVLFHLARILVLHWRKLKSFLESECTAGYGRVYS